MAKTPPSLTETLKLISAASPLLMVAKTMIGRTNCIRAGALVAFVLGTACASAAEEPAPTPTINGNVIEGVRNARYCEIIPIVRDGLHLVATVYNTLGRNDCPARVRGSTTENAMKQRFGAFYSMARAFS
jgi:hypothetical protein